MKKALALLLALLMCLPLALSSCNNGLSQEDLDKLLGYINDKLENKTDDGKDPEKTEEPGDSEEAPFESSTGGGNSNSTTTTKCTKCSGGMVTCKRCGGEGKVFSHYQNGTPMDKICAGCGGAGMDYCDNCNGTGQITVSSDSGPDGGSGYGSGGSSGGSGSGGGGSFSVECPHCKGGGKAECGACDGKGKVPTYAVGVDNAFKTCELCRGERTRPCAHCGGDGMFP